MKAVSWSRLGSIAAGVLSLAALGSLLAFGVTSEVPVGAVSGVVVMKTSGKPLPKAEVVLASVGGQFEEAPTSYSTRTDKDGAFKLRNLPSGLYQVDAFGKAHHNVKPVYVRVTEGSIETVKVDADRSVTEISIQTNQRVFLPEEKPTITVSGYTEAQHLQFQICAVSLDQLIEKRDPSTLVRSLLGDRTSWNPAQTPGLSAVRDDQMSLDRKDIEGHFAETVKLDSLPVGQYLVRASAEKQVSYSWITVTTIALVTKSTDSKVTAFVTDLKTGRPIAGAEVYSAVGRQKRRAGSTAQNGLFEFQLPVEQDTSIRFVLAEANGAKAFTWFYENSGGSSGKTVLFGQTDRPVYRPGDLVQYKVTARDSVATGYTVPTGNVDIEVLDPDQEVVSMKQLPLNHDGSVSGEFRTDPDSLPGSYSMRIKHGDSSDSLSIPIMSYRKPLYKIDVKPVSAVAVRGERARFKVHVETYTGEPVPGIALTGQIYSLQDWTDPNDENDMGYDDQWSSDYFGDYVDEVKSKTDESGDAFLEIRTDQKSDLEAESHDVKVTLSVTATDESGRTASGESQIKVVRGLFDLRITTDSDMTRPDATSVFHVSAVSHDTSKPLSGLKVDAVIGREIWNGKFSSFVVDEKRQVTIDQEGRADLSVTCTGQGQLMVKVSAFDERGHVVRAVRSVWNTESGDEGTGPLPGIRLILNKRNYSPEEKASLLVLTDHPGGSALMTIEAGGMRQTRVVDLPKKSNTLEIDSLADLAPNGIISVAYVINKAYYQAERHLNVDLRDHKLNVTIIPDRKTAVPGGQVKYKVQTFDPQGRPVASEVALGVVDESIYAVREDSDDPLKFFYPRRWSTVQTSYSFPTVYLDGEDKTPRAVKVRRNFQDTACWFPFVKTDSNGRADVTIELPDNLSEWRATATAISRDTRVGRSSTTVIAKKDVMVRVSLPAFFVEGDSQLVTARITNTSERELTLSVTMVGTGFKDVGPKLQTVRLKAGQIQTVEWPYTAVKHGTASVKVAAWDQQNGVSDGVEESCPVVVHGETVVESQVGSTTSSTTLSLNLEPETTSSSLTLNVSTTLLGSLVESLPSLVDYPYGCTEQTMSRFLPAILVSELMRSAGLHDRSIEDRIPDITRKSLQRLRVLQTRAGGWGWWEYDQPSADMTAYVLEGFWRMRPLGVQPRKDMLDRALEWSKKELQKSLSPVGHYEDHDLDSLIRLACSVMLVSPCDEARNVLSKVKDLKKRGTSTLAMLVVTNHSSSGSVPNARECFETLMARKEETNDTAHWPEQYGFESTGAAWEALSLVSPGDPLAEKIARYLFSKRRNGPAWQSTQDTSRILVSATRYLGQTRELGGDLTVDVTLNGTKIQSLKLNSTSNPTVDIPSSLLTSGGNKLGLQPVGSGKLFYSCVLTKKVRKQDFVAKGATDFVLKREIFRLTTQRLENGSLKRIASAQPVKSARTGEILVCRVTVSPRNDLTQFFCEVPIPSNMTIVDEDQPLDGLTWDWWWSRSVFLDDKAVFFGSALRGKPSVIEFAIRAGAPGVSNALPATLSRMYQPDDKATTSGYRMEVMPR